MTTEELALVPVERHESAAVVLWGTDDPRGMTARMTAVADAMAEAVRARGMANKIDGREYVRAEGWALVGAMVGVFPRTVALDEIREGGELVGFRATAELVSRDGSVVGAATALCTTAESKWANRDWNQIASMAQTRANAKAYRQTLGFIMPMAGYAPTPAEEMDGIQSERPRQQNRAQELQDERDKSWQTGARKFLDAAERKLKVSEADALSMLGVDDIDTLIQLAKDTEGDWTKLAADLKEIAEGMPF